MRELLPPPVHDHSLNAMTRTGRSEL